MTTIALSLAGGAFLLAFCLFLPTQAGQNATGSQSPPRWIQFPLAYYPSINTDVYENFIIWSEYGGEPGYEFTCTLTQSNPLHNSPTPALKADYLANFSHFGITSDDILTRQPPPPLKWDICLYDGQTGQISHVTNTFAQDQWPRIDGDWVVFRRGSIPFETIVVRNLITGQETELPHDYEPDTPNIHGNTVVYYNLVIIGADLNDSILAYDLTTQELMTITTSPNPNFEYAHVIFPDVYSGTIVWQGSPPNNQDYDIFGYDLNTQSTFTISDQAGNEEHPRIDGDLVVWDWQGDIYGYDLASGQRLTITQDAWFQWWPTVSGDLIVWMDYRNGRWDVYGYDLALGKEYWITENASAEAFYPAVWGNLVAWDHGGEGASAARKMSNFSFLPINLR